MRTTVSISDGLLSELRELARQKKRPFRELLEETIQRGLSVGASAATASVKIETHRIGVKSACQGLSLNQWYDHIEAGDVGKP